MFDSFSSTAFVQNLFLLNIQQFKLNKCTEMQLYLDVKIPLLLSDVNEIGMHQHSYTNFLLQNVTKIHSAVLKLFHAYPWAENMNLMGVWKICECM
jgi:hypothetical protein